MAFFQQSIAQVRQLWGRLSRGQQLALIGLGAGALIFAFVFLRMGGPQTYVTAFTNLDPKDSSAAADQLKAQNIPYQVTPDGTTIKVAPERLADARLKLAAKGLPQGGAVGFELFDKTSFGVTDFVQNINYQRALEGELMRTIDSLAQVEGSRVHIVVPKQELFVSQQKPATASVLLRLRPGRTLDEEALKGIAHLVARSVEGLDEKNITVLDSAGKMLFDGGQGQDGVAGLSTTQLAMQRKIEKNLEADLQSLLDRVAGPNRSAVRVKADLDFSQQETSSETFTPGTPNGTGVPRSSSSTTENFNGNGQNGAAGAAGAAANIPGARAGATPAAGSAGNSAYQRTDTTTNYEISRTTNKTTQGPGQLKRLSVSVVLDSSISEEDAAGLRDSLSAAAGIDQKRGDQIVVTTAAFTGAQPETIPVPKPGLLDSLAKYLKVLVPMLVALIVLLVVWRMSRSLAPKPVPALAFAARGALPAGAAAQAYALNAGGGHEAALAGGTDGQRALSEPQLTPEQAESLRRRNEVQERMTSLAGANPEALVEIIHDWMSQDDRKKK